jgi:hypothetical protein
MDYPTMKMRPLHCSEMMGTHHPVTLYHIPGTNRSAAPLSREGQRVPVGLQVSERSTGSWLSGDAPQGAFTPADGRLE